MSETLVYLDQALEAGERELACLLAGEVEEAEKLAFDRGKLVEEAWRMRGAGEVGALKEKLLRLQSLQGRLSVEAKRLHETLRRDLKKAKCENKRFSGYKTTVTPRPVVNRYLNKIG